MPAHLPHAILSKESKRTRQKALPSSPRKVRPSRAPSQIELLECQRRPPVLDAVGEPREATLVRMVRGMRADLLITRAPSTIIAAQHRPHLLRCLKQPHLRGRCIARLSKLDAAIRPGHDGGRLPMPNSRRAASTPSMKPRHVLASAAALPFRASDVPLPPPPPPPARPQQHYCEPFWCSVQQPSCTSIEEHARRVRLSRQCAWCELAPPVVGALRMDRSDGAWYCQGCWDAWG